MKLEHSFPTKVRALYMYTYQCYLCGGNGVNRGGLQIHHICGRKVGEEYLSSVFNSSLLCGECHEHVTHSAEERLYLFTRTVQLCYQEHYNPTEDDYKFVLIHAEKFGVTQHELLRVMHDTINTC